jgi:hypothetical protein
MLGAIQEQRADRCLPFQQWKHLRFPAVQDLINCSGIAVVPVWVAIHKNGIVRHIMRRQEKFISGFIRKIFAESATVLDDRELKSA